MHISLDFSIGTIKCMNILKVHASLRQNKETRRENKETKNETRKQGNKKREEKTRHTTIDPCSYHLFYRETLSKESSLLTEVTPTQYSPTSVAPWTGLTNQQ